MGFYLSFKDVFDAVRTDIEAKRSIKSVLLGEQFSYSLLPKAVINAMPSGFSQIVLGDMLEVKVNFSVIMVINEYEPQDWFADIIAVMADVVDAVLADRTLGGKLLMLSPRVLLLAKSSSRTSCSMATKSASKQWYTMNRHDHAKAERKFICELEVPPHTKVRVIATVDRKLCEEMELIHKLEIERAKAEDRTEPDWSNTIEMLLRKASRIQNKPQPLVNYSPRNAKKLKPRLSCMFFSRLHKYK